MKISNAGAALVLVLFVAALVGCEPEPERFDYKLVSIELAPVTWSNGTIIEQRYSYTAKFHVMPDSEFPGAAQEVTCVEHWNPATINNDLVEWFATHDRSKHTDIHTGGMHEVRSGVIYPADITGGNMLNGWTVLPQNSDGTVVTDTTKPFAAYNVNKLPGGNVTGRITREDRGRAIHWTVVADESGVTVIVDGKVHFEPFVP